MIGYWKLRSGFAFWLMWLSAFMPILVTVFVTVPVNAIAVFQHAFAKGIPVNAQSFGGFG